MGNRDEKPLLHLWLINFAADYLAVVAAYFVTLVLRFHSDLGVAAFTWINRFLGVRKTGYLGDPFESFYIQGAPRITTLIVITLVILYALHDLYPGRRFMLRRPVAWAIVKSNAIALGIFFAYFYLRRNVFHPRSIFVTVLFLNVWLTVAFRALAHRLLQQVRRRTGLDRCAAVVLGSGKPADMLTGYIEILHPHGISVAGHVPYDPERPFSETLRRLREVAEQSGARMLISAEPELSVSQAMQMLELADTLAIPVKLLTHRLEVLATKAGIPVDRVRGIPLIHFDAPSHPGRYACLRRAVSWGLAALALLAFLPIMLVSAILIKLTSPGNVFFVQERIGVNRKPFRMYKFRTMRSAAQEAQAEVEELNESGAGLFKIRKDPRVTPVGRFLRRFSLDELPQLVNVLKGDMAIVGPRPLPRRDFESYYEDWHYSRHEGIPGLTCLWQVSGRSDIDFHNMCILDVYYLRNRGWVLDLKIILRTVWAVLFAKGAY